MNKKRCTVIVLSAGQGKRMGVNVQKQYLEIDGRPIIYYALKVFQEASIIDEIVLVVGAGQSEFCENEIVKKYNINKVSEIVVGGAERFHSVHQGLQKVCHDGYVFIHDGARPLISPEIINRAYEEVKKYDACVVGMPVKDTIKKVDDDKFAVETPERKNLWQIQTPQVFSVNLIKDAYNRLMSESSIMVTDDAMVLEQMKNHPVKMVEGSYENIKITTPEDLEVAKLFLSGRRSNQ